MAQADGADAPQRGMLLRRAHELLEQQGQPASEELLIQHLFGANSTTGKHALWTMLLRQTLRSSKLFEESDAPDSAGDVRWSLAAWRSTPQQLDEVEFVVLDTETTGLRPGPDRASARWPDRRYLPEPHQSRTPPPSLYRAVHRHHPGHAQ